MKSMALYSVSAPFDGTQACASEPAELFFPENYIEEWHTTVKKAREVCNRCPLTTACLQYALTYGRDLDGIWGATTPGQRQEMLRGKLPTGRKLGGKNN